MIVDSLFKRICIYLERYYNMSDGEYMQQLREDIDDFKKIIKGYEI